MANIALVKLFLGMTMTSAQLAGQLVAHGHQVKVVYFKRQELIPLPDYDCDYDYDAHGYVQGDVPMRGYSIGKEGTTLHDSSGWKKNTPNELRHLVKMLKEIDADAIGISCLSNQMLQAELVTALIRENFDTPILWGGTGPTLEPERSMLHADVVCVGEGDEVIVEIAERLEQKRDLSGIAGTWFREPNGNIIKNPKRPVVDLETLAMPVWDDRYYAYINGLRFERMTHPGKYMEDTSYFMMTQRGCPFSCSFCVESFYQNEFGKKDSLRRLSPQKAIQELLYAKNILGYRTITFMDDVFTVNPRWLEEFLLLYKQEIDLPFYGYTYPTTHTPKLLTMLKEAGCHAITMGVQSGSYRILSDIYNRPTKIGRLAKAAQEIVASGIPAATFDFIPRTEFDTEEDLRETLELMYELPKEMDTSFYGTMAYFPNYPIMEKFQDATLLISTSDRLSEDTYLYYFKLYGLTRTPMPVEQIRTMAADPMYRQDHNLLNPFLNADLSKPLFGTLIDLGIQRVKAKHDAEKAAQLRA